MTGGGVIGALLGAGLVALAWALSAWWRAREQAAAHQALMGLLTAAADDPGAATDAADDRAIADNLDI